MKSAVFQNRPLTLALLLAATTCAGAAERIALDTLDLPAAGNALRRGPADAASAAALLPLPQGSTLQLLSQRTDAQGIRRSRYQQMHNGLPVFGEQIIVAERADGRLHALSGSVITGLRPGVSTARAGGLDEAAARRRAVEDALGAGVAAREVGDIDSRKVLHVDAQGQARVAWAVQFFADPSEGGRPTRPVRLIDAATGAVLDGWEGLTTQRIGTGPGGNITRGRHEYGVHRPLLDVTRTGGSCQLLTPDVKTVNANHGTTGSAAHSFSCPDNPVKAINGAFSPLNDAHYYGGVVFQMYRRYLDIAPLTFQLVLRVHYRRDHEDASWDGRQMNFGDGATRFHPLVGLDIVAHEVSHGFTEQQSGLHYRAQSGGINEAFSDIAGEAAEHLGLGSNDYRIGTGILKDAGALRYMDDPTRDGHSIGHASDYRQGMDVHFSSGVYNRAFFLLSRSAGWDVEKAFKAFARANMDHWTPSTDFNTGACGVRRAAADLGYRAADVDAAFNSVGVMCPG